jgi:hypothetical protein
LEAVDCGRAWRRASIERQKQDRASEDQEGNVSLEEKAERAPGQEDRNRANGGTIKKLGLRLTGMRRQRQALDIWIMYETASR